MKNPLGFSGSAEWESLNLVLQELEQVGTFHQVGRSAEARKVYEEILEKNPNHFEALHSLGVIAAQTKRLKDAERLFAKAIAINPSSSAVYYNRGNALYELGRHDEAVASYDRAIALKPNYAEAYSNRGNTLHELKRFDEALVSCDRAIVLRPDYTEAYYNRGNALKELRRFDEALASYDRAIALRPDLAEAYYNRGLTLHELKRFDEAVANHDRAIALKPDFAEAYTNRGNALHELKRFDEAVASHDRAIALKPDFASAHLNKSLALLLSGNFSKGWELYEWRWKTDENVKLKRDLPQPLWLGVEPLKDKTILLHGEQGLGDTIQFSRYVSLVEALGANVVLSVQDTLVRLVKSLSAKAPIVGSKIPPRHFDYQSPLTSMPLAFKTTEQDIPASCPYLRAEPDRVNLWKQRLDAGGFKIGIAWQGNPIGRIDAGRSLPVNYFSALSGVPGVRLISLQKNDGIEQLKSLPPGMKVETLRDDFDQGADGFIDTAAVMENLDLVVTSDTSIAHLAGALGRPTWVALKYVPDWRWQLDRSDSPWYPTMRLFRQTSVDDWSTVFAEMKTELAERLAAHPQKLEPSVSAAPRVPISWGELIDKITILEIKSERLADAVAVVNVRKELSLLADIARQISDIGHELPLLKARLKSVNEKLWDVEEKIREKERLRQFDQSFIGLARLVYQHNDERASIKRQINLNTASELREEKSY